MTSIHLYAGGKIKNSPFEEAWKVYSNRIHRWKIILKEMSSLEMSRVIWKKPQHWVFLDENGGQFSSRVFGDRLEQWITVQKLPVFFIGNSHGFPEALFSQPHETMSFGKCTYPHLLARILWIEQLYRAQQFLCNHPYSFV